MKSRKPATRAHLIERSLRCFRCAMLGLIPVLGIPFAVRAWVEYARLRRPPAGLWNPAARYLGWSTALASAGILLTLLVSLWIIAVALQAG